MSVILNKISGSNGGPNSPPQTTKTSNLTKVSDEYVASRVKAERPSSGPGSIPTTLWSTRGWCRVCRSEKPIARFSKKKNRASYDTECKDCLLTRRNRAKGKTHVAQQAPVDIVLVKPSRKIAVKPTSLTTELSPRTKSSRSTQTGYPMALNRHSPTDLLLALYEKMASMEVELLELRLQLAQRNSN